MIEGEKIIFRDGQVEKKASEYINISSLNMPNHKYQWPDSLEPDNFLKIIDKYRNPRNIKLIEAKNNFQISRFNQINIDKVKKLYQSLALKKSLAKRWCITNLPRKNADFFLQRTVHMK